MFKYLRLCAFLLFTTMVIYSCGGGEGNKGGDNLPISDITLNAAKIVAVKSNNPWQIIVSANGQPVNADNFTFTSDNDSSASVDENGLVTVHENNDATITVALKSDPTITASLQVEKHTFEKFYRYGYTIFAIDSNGGLYGWGANEFGQLGVGNFDNQTLPQKVTFPDGAKLSSMDNFIYNNNRAFALLDNGKLYAWGKNDVGQLGVGDTVNKPSPIEIPLPAKLLSMDNFTFSNGSSFALLDNGLFYAWGNNHIGQLGVGDTTYRLSPTLVSFTGGATLSSMDNFTIDEYGSAFALLDNGSFYAWGNNYRGQLGVGSPNMSEQSPKPVALPAKLLSMDNFTYSNNSSFALLNDGSFYAWGQNDVGQIGVGDTVNKASPAPVALPATLSSMDNFTFIGYSAFALLDNGLFYAWGRNGYGRLGVGDTTNRLSPTKITLPEGATLSSMDNFAYSGASGFALLDNGKFYAWGYNEYGDLGVNSSNMGEPSPQKVLIPEGEKLSSFNKFINGSANTFFITDKGFLYSVGMGDFGQLGNGSTDNQNTPQNVW